MNRDRFGTLNNPEIRLVKRQHSQRIFPLLRGFSIAVVLVCLLGAFIAGIIFVAFMAGVFIDPFLMTSLAAQKAHTLQEIRPQPAGAGWNL